MKFTILPQKKNSRKIENEKQFLTLDFPTTNFQWLHINCVSILAFFIPFFVLMFFMYSSGISPFGNKCLYVSDGLSNNISTLIYLQNLLKSDNYSIFTQHFSADELLFSFFYFFTSPTRFVTLFFPSANIITYLHLLTIIEISLSGSTFAFYLTHHKNGQPYATNDFSVLLFSCAYSLSGFMLTRYDDLSFIEIAMIFPLIFLTYESIFDSKRNLRFCLLIIIAFLSQFYLTLILLLFLFVYTIFKERDDSHTLLSDLSHYLYHTAISFLSSFVIILPAICLLYENKIKDTHIADFIFNNDWFTFFSRFFPANTTSFSFATITHSNNYYIGLFVLLLFPIYFFHPAKSIKTKVKTACFCLFLFFSINESQVQYICRLFCNDEIAINCYSFIVLFFILLYCTDSLYILPDTPKLLQIITPFVPLSLFFATVQYAKGTIRSNSIITTLILLVIYLMVWILHTRKSITAPSFYAILLLTTIVELSLNAGTVFQDINQLSVTTDKAFLSASQTYPILHTPFQADLDNFTLPEYFMQEDYDPASISETGSIFDSENEIFQTLLPNAYLFEEANITIACKEIPDEYEFKFLNNHVFSVGRKSFSQITYKEKEDKSTPQQPIQITLTITPDKSGDLYLYLDDFIHIGPCTEKQSFDYTFETTPSFNYCSNFYLQAGYLADNSLDKLLASVSTSKPYSITNHIFSTTITKDFEKDGLFVVNYPYSPYTKVYVDGSPINIKESVCQTTAIPVTKGYHTVQLHYLYTPFFIGFAIWGLSIFVLLFALKHPKYNWFITIFSSARNKIDHSIQKHKFFYLSFFIPFFVLCLSCFISSIIPFGNNSWFISDGFVLTYAMLKQRRYELLSGNLLYSWIMGSGTNIYNTMPTTLLSFWLIFIPEPYLYLCLTIFSITKISLCGSTMYYYLSRSQGKSGFSQSGYMKLIFSCGYALSAYMLNMNSYFHWSTVLFLFPLILLCLETLLTKNNPVPYTLLLAYSIITDYNTSLFICFFLIFWFFTFSYSSFKEFVKKGVLFAFSSVLSAGMSFWVLYALVSNLKISPYANLDSQSPTLLFYQSFWDTFKQLFPLCNPVVITGENGAINLYCGTFVVILLAVSVFQCRFRRKLLLKWFILAFLIISSNNELLSFIWNGLHYQIMVPNRYSFLTIFLMLDIAYESFKDCQNMKFTSLVMSTALAIVFCVFTIIFSIEKPSNASILMTAICLLVYIALLLLINRKNAKHSVKLEKLFFYLVISELSVATCCLTHGKVAVNMDRYAYYTTEHLKENILSGDKLERVNLALPYTTNPGTLSCLGSIEQFNSYLTKYQFNMACNTGCYHAENIITSLLNQPPFGASFSNVRYMLLNRYTVGNMHSINHYELIDYYNQTAIFENKKTFSTAFYLPKDAPVALASTNTHVAFANQLCSLFHTSGLPYTDIMLLNEKEKTESKTNYIIVKENEYKTSSNDKGYYHELHFTAPTTGEYYYVTEEYKYLGQLTQGEQYTLYVTADFTPGMLAVYHDEITQELYEKIAPYQFQTTSQTNTKIEGNITLPEDGIITFSIPYEPGWRAYLDGKEVPTHALRDANLYIEASGGHHTVTLKFFPQNLKLGVGITLLSWFVFILMALYIRRRKAKNNDF